MTIFLVVIGAEVWREKSTEEWASPFLVEARGRDNVWFFRYAGPDGLLHSDDDLLSEGVLRLPKGLPVKMVLQSDDLLYVFSCPELSLNEIALPEREFVLQFVAGEAMRSSLEMAPLCGASLAQDDSMGEIQVLESGAFENWWRLQK